MKKYFCYLILSILITANLYAEIDTCNCIPVASAISAKESSTHVFAGEVENIKLSETSSEEIDNNEKEFIVTLRVIKYWKGVYKDRIIIRTPHKKSACGFLFKKDKNYLIYAVGANHPEVNICSRTSELYTSNSISDLKVLGKAKYTEKNDEDLPDFLK